MNIEVKGKLDSNGDFSAERLWHIDDAR